MVEDAKRTNELQPFYMVLEPESSTKIRIMEQASGYHFDMRLGETEGIPFVFLYFWWKDHTNDFDFDVKNNRWIRVSEPNMPCAMIKFKDWETVSNPILASPLVERWAADVMRGLITLKKAAIELATNDKE